MIIKYLTALILPSLLFVSSVEGSPVVYEPQGEPNGKTIVFVASDYEYRGEEVCPALARILSVRHGFRTVVCFGVDEKGFIKPGMSNIPGLEHLREADGCVIYTRFQNLPDEQMAHIDDYLNRAGPIVAFRTSTHGFRIPEGSKYHKYDFQYSGKDYEGGFGRQVLGQSWVGHYGKNHIQSTRITILPEKSGHPILRGVEKIHVQAGGYNAVQQPDWTILTMAQPLMSMEADGEPDPTKPPMASEWTRLYQGKAEATGRVFTSLYGASEDLLNPGYRRMMINSIYWMVGLEDQIKADASIDFVGEYKPNGLRGGGFSRGIKPEVYRDLSVPVPANHNVAPRKKKSGKKKSP